jgi:hypothetical protein
MFSNLIYIALALLVTFVCTYYLSGFYFRFRKVSDERRDTTYLEEKIRIMEKERDKGESFQKMDPEQKKAFLKNLEKYKETLSAIRGGRLD